MSWWRRGVPVIVGPWCSEVGFEVLYWLPYVSHWRHCRQVPREQIVAVSRGGAGAWYDAGTTVELYDYLPPQDLRLQALQAQQTHGKLKQLTVTKWERDVCRLIAHRLGLRRYQLLHPSAMYRALTPWWESQTLGLQGVMQQLRVDPLPVPPLPVGLELPEKFVAVRFYQRYTWPMREELVDWTHRVIVALAAQIPVVIVGSSAYADDHIDFPAPTGPNILSRVDCAPLRENLAVQSAILARASAFVGTYGGVMQLASRLGRPAAGFYWDFKGTSFSHRALLEWLAVKQGLSVFIGRPQEADVMRRLFPLALDLPELRMGSSSGGG